MSRTLNELSNMSAESFLNPDNFRTFFDSTSLKYGAEQYAKGLEYGSVAEVVHISVRNVWSVVKKDGGNIQSYETIGYHSQTAELLRGFIDSGATIVVWRDDGERVTDTVIQGERAR